MSAFSASDDYGDLPNLHFKLPGLSLIEENYVKKQVRLCQTFDVDDLKQAKMSNKELNATVRAFYPGFRHKRGKKSLSDNMLRKMCQSTILTRRTLAALTHFGVSEEEVVEFPRIVAHPFINIPRDVESRRILDCPLTEVNNKRRSV